MGDHIHLIVRRLVGGLFKMDVAGETQASRQVGNGCDLVIVLQVYGLGVLAIFPKGEILGSPVPISLNGGSGPLGESVSPDGLSLTPWAVCGREM